MANVVGRRFGGNFVYVDAGAHLMRVVDAIGPDVIKWQFNPWTMGVQAEGATGTDMHGATTTVVEAGTGTSELAASNTAGIQARMTTAANEDDGISIQLVGEDFEFTSNQSMAYFGIEFAINDVDQTDVLGGLCITDTALLGGVSDGVYFESLDGSASVSTVTEKDSTETQNDSAGTLTDAGFHMVEFFFDGTSVYFFFDGSQTAIHTANIPDDEALTVSLEFLTGEATANTLDIRRWNAFQIGRT